MIWILELLPAGGGIIGGILFIMAIWGLIALFRWASENWGLVCFILVNIAIVIAIIRTIKNHDLGNVKAHGVVFSIFWWLGTLFLLVAGYSIKQYAAVYPNEMQTGFSVVLGILGSIAGTILLGRYAADECWDGSGEGAVGFGILAVIIVVSYAILGIGNAFNKIIMLVAGVVVGGIAGALAGAILGGILGGIGDLVGIGGALIGGLLGMIGGAGGGVLFGMLVKGMLTSSIGVIAAAEMVLAASFVLFKLFSPENETTLGKGKVMCLVLIWLAAIATTVVEATLADETDSLATAKISKEETFTMDAPSENGAAKIFQIYYGKDETVISVIRTNGSHKDVSISQPGEANSFFVQDADSGETWPLKEKRNKDYESAAGVELVFAPFKGHAFDLIEGKDTSDSAWHFRDIKIGYTTESGGIIFYDKGYYSNGWRYLEAAPASAEFTDQWNSAKRRLANSGIWNRLPTKDELNLIYKNLKQNGLGRFSEKDGYFSSNEGGEFGRHAWVQFFSTGEQDIRLRDSRRLVRGVRQF